MYLLVYALVYQTNIPYTIRRHTRIYNSKPKQIFSYSGKVRKTWVFWKKLKYFVYNYYIFAYISCSPRIARIYAYILRMCAYMRLPYLPYRPHWPHLSHLLYFLFWRFLVLKINFLFWRLVPKNDWFNARSRLCNYSGD